VGVRADLGTSRCPLTTGIAAEGRANQTKANLKQAVEKVKDASPRLTPRLMS
jgi:hypothetical protein